MGGQWNFHKEFCTTQSLKMSFSKIGKWWMMKLYRKEMRKTTLTVNVEIEKKTLMKKIALYLFLYKNYYCIDNNYMMSWVTLQQHEKNYQSSYWMKRREKIKINMPTKTTTLIHQFITWCRNRSDFVNSCVFVTELSSAIRPDAQIIFHLKTCPKNNLSPLFSGPETRLWEAHVIT